MLVTHDLDEAAELCEHCLVLDAGRPLQQDAMSTVIERPLSRRVAEIIGASNIFNGVIVPEDANVGSLDWNGHRIPAHVDGRNGANVTFLLREERLKLGPVLHGDANDLHGSVQQMRRRGSTDLISVRIDNAQIMKVRCSSTERPSLNDKVTVSVLPDAVWVFWNPYR